MSSYFPAQIVSTRLLSIALLLLAACGGRQSPVPDERGVQPGESEATPARHRPSALERGLEAASAGRFRAAAGWFEESIEREESIAEALENRAIVRAAQGRYDDAIDDVLAAIEAGDDDQARLTLAGIQVRANLFDAARVTLEPFVGGEFEPLASSLMAVALTATGEPEAARDLLRAAGDDHPLDAAALNNLGLVSEQLGDFVGARDLYDRAIGSDPEHYESWRNLGMLLTRLGENSSARRALQEYLLLAPEGVADRGVIEGRVARLSE